MRVGVMAEFLGTEAGGLETYTRELLRGLVTVRPDLDITAYTIRDTQLGDLAGPGFRALRLPSESRWGALCVALPRALYRERPDIVHVTSVAPLLCPCPSVFTIHDMSYRLHPEIYPATIRWRLDALISLGLRRARQVIAVSEATRRDLLAHYDLPESRVTVVPEAASPALAAGAAAPDAAEVRACHGLAGGYLLYVGRLHVRKNLVRLLEAYAALPAGLRAEHPLVLVGRRLYDARPVIEAVERLGLEGSVRFPGHVPDGDLGAVYAGAIAFVYPSLFEGFGLPPLEAMSLGIPVITSNRHALAEVAGEAGVLVDPTDVGALRDAMRSLLDDPALRARHALAGLARAAEFSWERAARETAVVYERAA